MCPISKIAKSGKSLHPSEKQPVMGSPAATSSKTGSVKEQNPIPNCWIAELRQKHPLQKGLITRQCVRLRLICHILEWGGVRRAGKSAIPVASKESENSPIARRVFSYSSISDSSSRRKKRVLTSEDSDVLDIISSFCAQKGVFTVDEKKLMFFPLLWSRI